LIIEEFDVLTVFSVFALPDWLFAEDADDVDEEEMFNFKRSNSMRKRRLTKLKRE
jgi:hypothetical protein